MRRLMTLIVGLTALAAEASRALEDARLAGNGAAARLDVARVRFAGTPFEADFAAVLEAVERKGSFPVLTISEQEAGSPGGS